MRRLKMMSDSRIDHLRHKSRQAISKLNQAWLEEFLLFGIKQAWACLFGALLLAGILVTHYWYPDIALHRFDFLFIYAVSIQIALIAFRLESWRELGVIMIFHVLATLMELFKTHDSIGSWTYEGDTVIRLGNVPLFAGFMYSAVGSYMARVWRGFEFQFENFPPIKLAVTLATLSYLNFFSHHFIFDIRWLLILGILIAYRKTWVCFRADKSHRKMPLLIGFTLVSFFIWVAENISTFARAWVYPNQEQGWQLIGPEKWTAWFLLMQLSFVLIVVLRQLETRIPPSPSQRDTR
ncbi:MAG: DUF817 domain-containing protein [Opitutales bacterium]